MQRSWLRVGSQWGWGHGWGTSVNTMEKARLLLGGPKPGKGSASWEGLISITRAAGLCATAVPWNTTQSPKSSSRFPDQASCRVKEARCGLHTSGCQGLGKSSGLPVYRLEGTFGG